MPALGWDAKTSSVNSAEEELALREIDTLYTNVVWYKESISLRSRKNDSSYVESRWTGIRHVMEILSFSTCQML